MAFQNTINRFTTDGIQGDLANGQVPHYSALTPRVKEGETIYAGDFVWVADAGNGNAFAVKSTESDIVPTGIVQRVFDIPLPVAESATLQIPAGRKCDVIVWGDVFVKVSNEAAVGKKIFVKKSDGTILCDDAEASVSGAIETGWTVVSLAGNPASETGSVVIVSNV